MSEEKMAPDRFMELCAALPPDTYWGDAITPDIVAHIWQAALQESEAGAVKAFRHKDTGEIRYALSTPPHDETEWDDVYISTAPQYAQAIETAAIMRAAAWLHPITGAVIKASDRIDGVTLTDFNIPLYLAPTTHPAIEAAAILHAADVCDRISLEYQWAAEEGKLKSVKWNRNMWKSRTAAEIAKQICALIPQDGRTALEEFGVKVAQEVFNECQKPGRPWEKLHTIVTNLMNGGGK